MELLAVKKTWKGKGKDGEPFEMPILVPAFRSQYAVFNKYADNQQIILSPKMTRNMKQHNLLFVISMYVFDNKPEWVLIDDKRFDLFREWVSLEIDYVDTYTIKGDMKRTPRSWSVKATDSFVKDLMEPALHFYEKIMEMTIDELKKASSDYAGATY